MQESLIPRPRLLPHLQLSFKLKDTGAGQADWRAQELEMWYDFFKVWALVNSFSFLDPRPHYRYLTNLVGIQLNSTGLVPSSEPDAFLL